MSLWGSTLEEEEVVGWVSHSALLFSMTEKRSKLPTRQFLKKEGVEKTLPDNALVYSKKS